MRMFIPEIGTTFALKADWSFLLIGDARNKSVRDAYLAPRPDLAQDLQEKCKAVEQKYEDLLRSQRRLTLEQLDARYAEARVARAFPFTLPAGTILKVDRLYIRKGASDFSSVTFFIEETGHPDLQPQGKSKKRKRFFAPLPDVNTIEFDLVET